MKRQDLKSEISIHSLSSSLIDDLLSGLGLGLGSGGGAFLFFLLIVIIIVVIVVLTLFRGRGELEIRIGLDGPRKLIDVISTETKTRMKGGEERNKERNLFTQRLCEDLLDGDLILGAPGSGDSWVEIIGATCCDAKVLVFVLSRSQKDERQERW